MALGGEFGSGVIRFDVMPIVTPQRGVQVQRVQSVFEAGRDVSSD